MLKEVNTIRIEGYLERLMPNGRPIKFSAGARDRSLMLGQTIRGPAHGAAEVVRNIINANTKQYLERFVNKPPVFRDFCI